MCDGNDGREKLLLLKRNVPGHRIALTSNKIEKKNDRALTCLLDVSISIMQLTYITSTPKEQNIWVFSGNIWHRLNGIFNPRHVSNTTRTQKKRVTQHARGDAIHRGWISG